MPLRLLRGPSSLPSRFARSLCPALARGLQVYWIDAGSSFDAHGLGCEARSLGLDPLRVLSRIRLSRPFNVFQLETIIRVKLPAVWKGEPVVLADLLIPFIDEDLPLPHLRRMLPRVLEGIERLPAEWLGLVVEREIPPGRENVLMELKKDFALDFVEGEGIWAGLCLP